MSDVRFSKFGLLLYLCYVYTVFFFPTSRNGVIKDSTSYYILYYGLCCTLSVCYGVVSRFDSKRTSLLAVLFLYLLFSTIFSGVFMQGQFAIARMLFTLVPIITMSVNPQRMINGKTTVVVTEVLTIVLILWNLGIILQNTNIINITNMYYSQFKSVQSSFFINSKRPIFTFGVYNYAAFFYAGLFIVWLCIIREGSYANIRYYVYPVMLMLFQIMLRGSTALILGLIMLLCFLNSFGTRRLRFFLVPILLVVGIYYIHSLNYDWSRLIVGNETNGFISRYRSGLFDANFTALRESVFGIGWNIIDYLPITYTDSGYIVYLTMGSLIMPTILYYCLYDICKFNLPTKYSISTFLMCMLFEFALPGLLYSKLVLFIAYMLMTIRNVCSEDSYRQLPEHRRQFRVRLR